MCLQLCPSTLMQQVRLHTCCLSSLTRSCHLLLLHPSVCPPAPGPPSSLPPPSLQAKRHVPYRDSKLTRLLQSSLSGNSHMAIITTISPAGGEGAFLGGGGGVGGVWGRGSREGGGLQC
jgi:hypothetical protein